MADYVSVLADLRAQRDTVERERTELDGLISGLERILAAKDSAAGPVKAVEVVPQASPQPATSSPSPGLRMPQVITRLLEGSEQPQTTVELVEAVKTSGIKTRANVRGHVYNTLHRLSLDDGPFQRLEDGRWILRRRDSSRVDLLRVVGDR